MLRAIRKISWGYVGGVVAFVGVVAALLVNLGAIFQALRGEPAEPLRPRLRVSITERADKTAPAYRDVRRIEAVRARQELALEHDEQEGVHRYYLTFLADPASTEPNLYEESEFRRDGQRLKYWADQGTTAITIVMLVSNEPLSDRTKSQICKAIAQAGETCIVPESNYIIWRDGNATRVPFQPTGELVDKGLTPVGGAETHSWTEEVLEILTAHSEMAFDGITIPVHKEW